MPAVLAIDTYLIEAPTLAAPDRPDDPAKLAEISAEFERARGAREEQRAKFEQLYRDAEALSPDELGIIERSLLAQERLRAAIFVPIIKDAEVRMARRYRAQTPAQKAIVRLIEDSHDIASGWLELYQNLRIRLAKLASDKLAAEGHPGSPIISSSDGLARHLRSIAPEGS
jgi:hypothetical protein